MDKVNNISGKSVGRPVGGSDAKQKIIEAARIQFAKGGYDRSSLRQIASRADLDPSLIVHHFGSKQKLFVESMLPLFEGPKFLPSTIKGDPSSRGMRLATLFVTFSSEPSTRDLMLGLFRSANSEDQAAQMFREFIQNNITEIIEHQMPGPNKKLQANILSSQMIGMFIAKYIVKIEPLASASNQELIEYLAPRIQAHF